MNDLPGPQREQDEKSLRGREAVSAKSARKAPPRLLILAIVMLVILLSAGYFFRERLLSLFTGAASGEQIDSAHPRYQLPLREFQINLADSGSRRYLQVSMVVAFDETALDDELSGREYEIRSYIISVLRSKTVSDLEQPDGMHNLRESLIGQLNELLLTGQVRDIYFDEFIIQ